MGEGLASVPCPTLAIACLPFLSLLAVARENTPLAVARGLCVVVSWCSLSLAVVGRSLALAVGLSLASARLRRLCVVSLTLAYWVAAR